MPAPRHVGPLVNPVTVLVQLGALLTFVGCIVFAMGFLGLKTSGPEAVSSLPLAATLGMLMMAFGVACFGLMGLVLWAYPEYLWREEAERLRGHRTSPRAYALTAAWAGLSAAAELALVATAGRSVLFTVPGPAILPSSLILALLSCGPAYVLRVIGHLRRQR